MHWLYRTFCMTICIIGIVIGSQVHYIMEEKAQRERKRALTFCTSYVCYFEYMALARYQFHVCSYTFIQTSIFNPWILHCTHLMITTTNFFFPQVIYEKESNNDDEAYHHYKNAKCWNIGGYISLVVLGITAFLLLPFIFIPVFFLSFFLSVN